MRTPQAVKDAAKFLTDMYPATYYHIGVYDGYEVYRLAYKGEPPLIGLPTVFLYKEGEEVLTIGGYESFDIMDVAAKFTRERRKAARLAKQKKLKD